jgi:hypothetical protein
MRTPVSGTVARARGGEGPPWGCTVIPLVGDTFIVMKPQVTLTSGMAHTCAAPGAQPQVGHIYVCAVSHLTPALGVWLGDSLLGSPEAALAQRVGPVAHLLHAGSVEP